MTTLATRTAELKQRFERAEMPTPHTEAKELLCEALDTSPEELYWRAGELLSDASLQKIAHFEARRLTGEPLAYICERIQFNELRLAIDRRALIPRPETEALARRAADWLSMRHRGVDLLDLGCGSGCLAIYLKWRFPKTHVMASDQSEDALALSRLNAQRQGVEITWRCGDWLKPWREQSFDCILVNPPYIAEADWRVLDPQVRDFEPKMALVSGFNGLEVFEIIARDLHRHLRAGGLLLAEMGYDQATAVEGIFEKSGFNVAIERDDWGKRRFLKVQRLDQIDHVQTQ